ncbi:MAG: MFS transporter [Planctomycetes bacterium]|nr:MFS transporter [Planctomycetota bacterium]MBL7042960.1 MFS transporter [Pirellulaceae bacterium]
MNLAIPTWIAGLLACGMGVALLGSVMVVLAQRLKMDEARVGGLVSMFGFAMIPVMLAMGFLTDLIDKQIVVVIGSFLMVVSLLVLSRATKYWSALLAVLLLSAGWSALVNVLNVLMQAAFGGTEVYAMNLGNFFFGLGAFLTPLVIAFLLKRAGFVPALLVLAALALTSGVLALGVDFEAFAAAGVQKPAAEPAAVEIAAPGVGLLLGDSIMWLTALALLFYAPMEATMAAWATTYLGDKGMSEGRAATLLSGFWLAFMCSRLATALLVWKFGLPAGGETVLIIVLSVLCLLVWAGAVFSPGRAMAGAMVVLAGLVFGPTFPTIIGVLMGHVKTNISPDLGGRAVGLFFMIGGIGWSVIPILIGAYARKTSVQRGFLIAVAAGVGLTAVAVGLHLVAGG